ncbi:hypothetical protein MFIFM68171_01303 [Madurella fahalii]|uniref:Uncharacterized protein n=1 Tax=Madurella fahalii TaxID=1157608 RepID=A0ABQ0G015_9PEZI
MSVLAFHQQAAASRSNPLMFIVLGSGSPSLPPRILPIAPANYSPNNSLATPQSSRRPTSPPKTTRSRTVFTATKARPLRLVQESLNRKRRPPVFYAQRSRSAIQSLTYITIHQQDSSSAPSPTTVKMATNPIMPKVAPLPSIPSTSSRPGDGGKDRLLADLRRQLDDSASDASSVDSRGRRRRRNNKQLAQAGGLTNPAVLPRLADTKPVRLQLGLNLDVEVELKARLQGDVSLTLLVEKQPSARPSSSAELVPDASGVVADEYAELFYMRVGRFRLRQRWINREVSPSLTAAVVLLVATAGFVLGFAAARYWDGPGIASLLGGGAAGLGLGEAGEAGAGGEKGYGAVVTGVAGLLAVPAVVTHPLPPPSSPVLGRCELQSPFSVGAASVFREGQVLA